MCTKVPYLVKVLVITEDIAEVYAVTEDEALHLAEQIPGVAKAVGVTYE